MFISNIYAQTNGVEKPVATTGESFKASVPTWIHGTVDIVESFKDKIYVRWQGRKTQDCAKSDDVVLTLESVGSKEALDRAFKIAMTAAVSGKPIRFLVDGCIGKLQQGKVVQLCANAKCSY